LHVARGISSPSSSSFTPALEKFNTFIKFITFDRMDGHPDSGHKKVDHLLTPLVEPGRVSCGPRLGDENPPQRQHVTSWNPYDVPRHIS
jgi:hypothetical protein